MSEGGGNGNGGAGKAHGPSDDVMDLLHTNHYPPA